MGRKLIGELRSHRHFAQFMKVKAEKASVEITTDEFKSLCARYAVDEQVVAERLREMQEGRYGSTLGFDNVHDALLELQEQTCRRRRAKELGIKRKWNLPADKFFKHRNRLLKLSDVFSTYDTDEDGRLNGGEARLLLRQMPVILTPCSETLLALLTSETSLDFAEFLEFMERVRAVQREAWRPELDRIFRNANGELEFSRVRDVLLKNGLRVQNEVELDVVQRVVLEFDALSVEDAATLEDLCAVCETIDDCLFDVHRVSVLEYASSLGIGSEMVAEYRWAFAQVDVGECGLRDVDVVKLFRVLFAGSVSLDVVREVMDKAQRANHHRRASDAQRFCHGLVNDRGRGAFLEFLTIMQVVTTCGVAIEVGARFTLQDVPQDSVKQMLRPFVEDDLSDAPVQDLQQLSSICLELGWTDNLCLRDEPISNTKQLMGFTTRRLIHLSESVESTPRVWDRFDI